MGGDAEKLLTLEEATRRLGRSADDVESLVRSGKLPSFRLGGNLLRIRARDVETLRRLVRPERLRYPKRVRLSPWDRFKDFLYFNDFYLVTFLVLLTLLALILAL